MSSRRRLQEEARALEAAQALCAPKLRQIIAQPALIWNEMPVSAKQWPPRCVYGYVHVHAHAYAYAYANSHAHAHAYAHAQV